MPSKPFNDLLADPRFKGLDPDKQLSTVDKYWDSFKTERPENAEFADSQRGAAKAMLQIRKQAETATEAEKRLLRPIQHQLIDAIDIGNDRAWGRIDEPEFNRRVAESKAKQAELNKDADAVRSYYDPKRIEALAQLIGGEPAKKIAGGTAGAWEGMKGKLNDHNDARAAATQAIADAGGDFTKAETSIRDLARATRTSSLAAGAADATEKAQLEHLGKLRETLKDVPVQERLPIIQDVAKLTAWTEDESVRRLSLGGVAINPQKLFGDKQSVINEIEALNISDTDKKRAKDNYEAMRENAVDPTISSLVQFDSGFDSQLKEAMASESGVGNRADFVDRWMSQQASRNPVVKSLDALWSGVVVNGGLGMVNTVLGITAGLASTVGAGEWVGTAHESSSRTASGMQQAQQQRGLTGGYGVTKDLAGTITQMAPMFIGGAYAQGLKGLSAAATSGMSVYGWAGMQGYESAMSTELELAMQQRGTLSGSDVEEVLGTGKAQLAGFANAVQTALLAKVLGGGAEAAALGKASGTMTVRDFLTKGGRAALENSTLRTELKGLAKNIFVNASDEAVEETLNQVLENVIAARIQGADRKIGDVIGEALSAGAMGSIAGGALPQIQKGKQATQEIDTNIPTHELDDAELQRQADAALKPRIAPEEELPKGTTSTGTNKNAGAPPVAGSPAAQVEMTPEEFTAAKEERLAELRTVENPTPDEAAELKLLNTGTDEQIATELGVSVVNLETPAPAAAQPTETLPAGQAAPSMEGAATPTTDVAGQEAATPTTTATQTDENQVEDQAKGQGREEVLTAGPERAIKGGDSDLSPYTWNGGEYRPSPGTIFQRSAGKSKASSGWKAHVTAPVGRALEVLNVVLPILNRRGVSHKFVPVERWDARSESSNVFDKLVTVYSESDEQAAEIIREVDAALSKAGLSNGRWSSKNNEYRYGDSGLISARDSDYYDNPYKGFTGDQLRKNPRLLPDTLSPRLSPANKPATSSKTVTEPAKTVTKAAPASKTVTAPTKEEGEYSAAARAVDEDPSPENVARFMLAAMGLKPVDKAPVAPVVDEEVEDGPVVEPNGQLRLFQQPEPATNNNPAIGRYLRNTPEPSESTVSLLNTVVDELPLNDTELNQNRTQQRITKLVRDTMKKHTKPTGKGDNFRLVVKLGSIKMNELMGKVWKLKNRVAPGWKNFRSAEAVLQRAKIIAYEIASSISKTGSGNDWYSGKINEMYQKLSRFYPELREPGQDRFIFSTILAITSNGENVFSNMVHTINLYNKVRGQGRMPNESDSTGEARRENAMFKGFATVQRLIEKDGWQQVDSDFRKNVPYRDMKKRYKIDGKEEKQDQLVSNAYVLGSKIGAFWGNLNGNFGHIAMDLWFTRTMARLSGDFKTIKPKNLLNIQKHFRMLTQMDNVPDDVKDEMRHFLNAIPKMEEEPNWTSVPEEVRAQIPLAHKWIKDSYKTLSNRKNPETNKAFFQATPEESSAKIVHILLDQANRAPDDAEHRNWMRRVMNTAQKHLKANGIEMSLAEMQAVMWFYEKDLYTKFGATSKRGERADFSEAADYGLARVRQEAFTGDAGPRQDELEQGTLFQNEEAPKGSYLPAAHNAGKAILDLATGKADQTTGLHEAAHTTFDFMDQAKLLTEDESKVVKDWASNGTGKMDVAAWEKFARGWERFVLDGVNTGIEAVDKVFAKIASYIANVYKNVKGSSIDIEIPENIREIFNKMAAAGYTREQQGKAATAVPVQIKAESKPTTKPANKPAGKKLPKYRATPTTAIYNAATDAELVRNGMSPILKEASVALQDTWDDSMARMANNPDAGRELVAEILAKPRVASDVEHGLLLQEFAARKVAVARARNNMLKDPSEGARRILDNAMTALYDVAHASNLTGAEWGRAGRFRQIRINEDYSIESMQTRYMAEVKGGESLSEEESTRIAELSDKLRKMEEEEELLVARLRESERALEEAAQLDHIAKQVKRERVPPSDQKRATVAKKIGDRVSSARDRLAKMGFGGRLFQMAGEKAQQPQFQRDSLDTAKAMAAAGKSSEEIRAVTGWFPGKYDGKMRWEIPDEGAKAKPLVGVIGTDGVQTLREGGSVGTTLGELLDHPALFEAYPDLANVAVVLHGSPLDDGNLATYKPGSDSVLVGLNAQDAGFLSDGHISSLLHEVQHAIQKREKFARGSSPKGENMFGQENVIKGLEEEGKTLWGLVELARKGVDLSSRYDAGGVPRIAEQIREIFPEMEQSSIEWWLGQLNKRGLRFPVTLEEAERAYSEQEDELVREVERDTFDEYTRTAGEIEARDVQARARMTPEQLRATAPYSSENIAEEDAIVLYQKPEPASLDPQVLSDMADVGVEYLNNGDATIGKFTDALVNEFGDAIKPHAKQILAEARKRFKSVAATTKGPRSVEQLLADVDSEAPKLTRELVYNMARAVHMQGARKEEILDQVTELLQDEFPDVTRAEVAEAFTGYGKIKTPSQEQINIDLRELRNADRITLQIDDVEAGQAPKKTGTQRDKATVWVREKMALLKAAMKKAGMESIPGADRLKGTLDSIKSNYKNRIEELEIAIKRRQKLPPKTTGVTYDTEATQLKERVTKLREEYNAIFGENKDLTDEQRIKRAIDSLSRRIKEEKAMRDANQFRRPAGKPAPDSPEIQILREELAALVKTRHEAAKALIDSRTPEQRALDRAVASVEKSILENEQILATGQLPAPRTGAPAYTPSQWLQTQRARLQTLQKQVAKLRRSKLPRLSAEEKERRRAISYYTKAIARLQAVVNAGVVVARTRPDSSAYDPAVSLLKRENARLRATVQEIRENARPKLTDDQKALLRDKSAIRRRITVLENKLATGDYTRPVKRPAGPGDKELADLRLRKDKLLEQWNENFLKAEFERMSKFDKSLIYGQEVVNVSRALITSVDFSAVGRQGAFIAFGRPVMAARAIPTTITAAFSANRMQRLSEEIQNHPTYALSQQAGLFLADNGPNNLTKQEEAFRSRLSRKAPFKYITIPSERAYNAFLNQIRINSFSAIIGSMGAGVTVEEAQAVARFVNIATGRGDLGRLEQAAGALSTVFFSPKFVVSRFQLLSGLMTSTVDAATGFKAGDWLGKKETNRARKAVARQYARSLIGVATCYGLIMLAKAGFGDDDDEVKIENDPRSSDFAKIKIGNTRYDFMGGIIQAAVFLSRVATRTVKKADGEEVSLTEQGWKKDSLSTIIGSFIRTKLAPGVGTTINAWGQKDVFDKPTTASSEIIGSLIPLTFGDIYSSFHEHGYTKGIPLSVLVLFGIGVQTHNDRLDLEQQISVMLGLSEKSDYQSGSSDPTKPAY